MSKSIVICGVTKKGLGLGKTLGFPTINIDYEGELSGVFAGEVEIAGNKFVAAINVGGRPTVAEDGDKLCEAFLLDFCGEIKEGTEVKVHFLRKIREVEKFPNLEALKAQIATDVEFVKTCYNLAKK